MTAALVLAACGDRSSAGDRGGRVAPLRVSTLAGRMDAVGSARVVQTITNFGPAGAEGQSTSEGVIDLAHRRAEATVRTTDEHGKVRVVRYRQIDDEMYVDGDEGEFSDVRGNPWVQRFQPWFEGVYSSFAEISQAASAGHVRVARLGSEDVRGVATTHYRIDSKVPVPPKLEARGYSPGVATFEIWADADQLTRRVLMEDDLPGPGPDPENRFRSVTEFFDFGVDVQVSAPPADEVVVDDDHFFRKPVPTGSWTVVGSGDGNDVAWEVSTIPTEDGWCWALDTSPAEASFGAEVAGRVADVCGSGSRDPDDPDDPVDPVDVHLRLLSDGTQLYFGSVDPEATLLTLHYDDGETGEVLPVNGTAVFAVTGDRLVTKIVPKIPDAEWTCKLDVVFSLDVFYNCSGFAGGSEPPGSFPDPSLDPSFPDPRVPTTAPNTAPPGAT